MHQPRRCRARRANGTQCRGWAMRGQLVCRQHGGLAPQSRAAAERRLTQERAERAAARLLQREGVDRDPAEHLLAEVHRSAAVVQVLGELVATLDDAERQIDRRQAPTQTGGLLAPRPGPGEITYAVVHPFVVLWTEERERHAKLAKLALDAGVAERQVRLAERQAELLVKVVNAALADPEWGLDATQQRAGRRVLARQLRALEAPAS